jgi:hypothetical protein
VNLLDMTIQIMESERWFGPPREPLDNRSKEIDPSDAPALLRKALEPFARRGLPLQAVTHAFEGRNYEFFFVTRNGRSVVLYVDDEFASGHLNVDGPNMSGAVVDPHDAAEMDAIAKWISGAMTGGAQ